MSIGEFLDQQALAINACTTNQTEMPYQDLISLAERHCAEWHCADKLFIEMLVAITIYTVVKNRSDDIFANSLVHVKNKIHFLRYQSIAEIKRTLTEIIEQL